jgi:hypothetical protein
MSHLPKGHTQASVTTDWRHPAMLPVRPGVSGAGGFLQRTTAPLCIRAVSEVMPFTRVRCTA